MNRHADRWTLAIAVLAGVAASLAGAQPTGARVVDVVLVALAAGAATWFAGAASPLLVVLVTGIAAATTLDLAVAAIATVAFLGGLVLWVRRAGGPVAWTLVAAVALNALARSQLEWFFGASALVGVTTATALVAFGALALPGRSGQRVRRALGATAAVGLLATVVFVAAALSARRALEDGNAFARRGLELLGEGETAAAQRAFSRSADAFEGARGTVGGFWTAPALLVPIAAQHRSSLVTLVDEAAAATTDITEHLAGFDLDGLRVDDGRLDLAAVRALAEPLDGLQRAVDVLRRGAESARSPWLLPPAQRRIDALVDDLDAQRERGELAEEVLALAPSLLGADGPRVYLVAFTTPAEARGHGGFMGNFAELTIDDGRVELTDFGRSAELNRGGRDRVLTGPPEWLDRYGRYGFVRDDGTVGRVPWLNITMSPHFPSTGQVMAELYPQSGGRPVDGVIALDVATMAALLEFTGPVEVPRLRDSITPENAEEFLLLTQYRLGGARLDLLQDVALAVVDELLGGALPGPAALGRTLGPMVSEGRLTAYAVRDDEQVLFERLGMAGALPDLDGGDGLAITFNNAAGSKIDNFLDVEIDYRVGPVSAGGEVAADLVVTVTNSAPTEGYPDYVIGNVVGLPVGTNQTLMTVFSAMPVTSVSLDGDLPPIERSHEQGYEATMTSFVIPPGATRVIEMELWGSLELAGSYRLAVRLPPAARPFDARITYEPEVGRPRQARVLRPGVHQLEVRR